MKTKFLVMGIGNPMLKDDRAGIEVAERIGSLFPEIGCEIVYGVGFEVNDKIMDCEQAVIIDAAKMGHEPGTIIEVTVDDIFNDNMLASSHAMTLGSTLKAGYQLFADKMPPVVRIILIEAEDYFEFTDKCSPKVVHAIDNVVSQLSSEIETLLGCSGHQGPDDKQASAQPSI